MMNDYFLRILVRQRHEEILAEARAIKLSRLARSRAARVNQSIHPFLSFLSGWRRPTVFQPPVADEGKSV